MFLVKNNKSSFYQIVYFVDGKRTTHSTKKTTQSEAVQYLEEFKKSLANPSGAAPLHVLFHLLNDGALTYTYILP